MSVVYTGICVCGLPWRSNLKLTLLLHEECVDDDLCYGRCPHDQKPEEDEGEGPEEAVLMAVKLDGGFCACHFVYKMTTLLLD